MLPAFQAYSQYRLSSQECERPIRPPRNNPLRCLTERLIDSLKLCSPHFRMIEKVPRRVLTHPVEPHPTCPDDNVEHNLICRVHDELHDEVSGETYKIVDLLGTGTFGQVLRCRRVGSSDSVAVKIIKNKAAYRTQSLLETRVLKLLNNKFDPDNKANIVRMLGTFDYKEHACLVFELLDYSLYDLLTQNQYRGLPLFVIQNFTKQILSAMVVLQEANVIHCDLKPENIMLSVVTERDIGDIHKSKSMDSVYDRPVSAMECTPSPLGQASSPDALKFQIASKRRAAEGPARAAAPHDHHVSQSLKVIDFGSVCFESKIMFHYIQSRFYRSPEVLIGFPYNGAIDMWSLGCVCCEMFLGLPIFPGVSQHNQLTRIIEMLGMPSDTLLEHGNLAGKYFKKTSSKNSPKKPNRGEANVPSPRGLGNTTAGTQSEKLGMPISRSNSATQLQALHNVPSGKYRLKTAAEYAKDTNTKVPVLKKYLKHDKFDDVILKYPYPHIPPGSYKDRDGNPVSVDYIISRELKKRECFLHFLHGLLKINPWERWTAKQAIDHPFITNELCTERSGWIPAPDPKVNERVFAVISQVQAKEAKAATRKHASSPAPVVPPQSPATGKQASAILATVSESSRNSFNSNHATPAVSDGNVAAKAGLSRSSSRQSFESYHSTNQPMTCVPETGKVDALPSGAVRIASPEKQSNVALPRTSPEYAHSGSWERQSAHAAGVNSSPGMRPPLPKGPPPRQGAAVSMASASYPPPISAIGMYGPWAGSFVQNPPLPPTEVRSSLCPTQEQLGGYNTPPSSGLAMHKLNPADFSPRTKEGMYMHSGDMRADTIRPSGVDDAVQRKPRALTQINLYQHNLNVFNSAALPPPLSNPNLGSLAPGGFRRESYTGPSSIESGVVSDFDLAILRTPTDQSRVFQSKHDLTSDSYAYNNCRYDVGSRPPPPPVPPLPPQYPRVPHAEPPQYYPSSYYGVAQSYDSYRPMVMQHAIQNYYQEIPRTAQPPLPPGPPPSRPYDSQMLPPAEPLHRQFSGLNMGPQELVSFTNSSGNGYGGTFVPPQPLGPRKHIKQQAKAAPIATGNLHAVRKGASPPMGNIITDFNELASNFVEDPEEELRGSLNRSKVGGDDADPFFALDDV